MITTDTFETFLSANRQGHYLFAKRLTRNSDDAEDLLQEAKIRALRALGSLNSAEVPEAWFRQIMKNCFLDNVRYRGRRPVTTSLEAIQESNPVFDVADPAIPLIPLLGDDDEYSTAVKEALSKLTQQQQTLVLAASSGITCKELSGMLRCGVITVRTRLHRAHRLLRRHLLASQVGNRFQGYHRSMDGAMEG